jgi:hypothetical protein
VRDAPDVEPLDYAEAAQRWRKRAEVLFEVHRVLDDLAVRYRNAAHGCDEAAATCDDLAAQQRPPDDGP